MPGARTYQAIGYATYHGGRFYGKQKRAELERQSRRKRKEQQGAVAAGVAVAALGLVVVLARRAGRVPSV